ncbi:MAG: outer membrane beta-barrel protein, partial [Mucilaginibacter sp.]
QGKAVDKVLVEGEEFFGDDPTLVTKNIRADMVDKVQLYDKASDQAAFTGIDDGQKTKTLNIKLKDNKKNGSFGKAEAGVGTDGYYVAQLLFNAFKEKQKFSVYGITGNNGKLGLGWHDSQKYGSSEELQQGDDGSLYITGSGDDLESFSGQYNGQGLPTARTGGVHYENKWNSEKESINTNYKIGSINVDGTNETLTQNNQPGKIFNTNSDQTTHNSMFRQKLDAVYKLKIDTSSDLKIIVGGTQKHSETRNSTTGSTIRNDTLANSKKSDLINNVDQNALNASAFYSKKFSKPGRTFSLTIEDAYSKSNAKGFLKGELDYYNPQKQVDSTQITDQYKTSNLQSNAIKANATWSEPFSKTLAILFNYGIGVDNSSADRKSYNASSPSNYNILIDSLSSNFRLTQFSNRVGAIFNYKKGKTIINFGTRVSDVNYKQVDELSANSSNRNFINWAPQARYQYRFSQYGSFSVNYNGRTDQPTLDQLQPLKSNVDLINTVVGNPNLRPSFTHNFSAGYNSYKLITGESFYVYSNYSVTTDPIVTNVSTSRTGKSTSQAFNLGNKNPSSLSISISSERKLEKSGINIGIGLDYSGGTYYNLSSNLLNMTKNYTYSPTLGISKFDNKIIGFLLRGGPTYTISQSSLHPEQNNNGWGAWALGQFSIKLPCKIEIGSDDNYQYTGATQSFQQDFSRLIVNAFIAKKFLKSEGLKLTLSGNDLLNQNAGFNRNASGSYITQNSYTTIKRYFMFTITYDFSKMGAGTLQK